MIDIVEEARKEADRLEAERKAAEERHNYFIENGLAEGYIAQYILSDGPSKGQHRPAVVVKAWRDVYGYLTGTCQLQVLTDSNPEGQYNDLMPAVMWKSSVMFDDSDVAEGCWHWKEGVEERAKERREALETAQVQAETKAAAKGKVKAKKETA